MLQVYPDHPIQGEDLVAWHEEIMLNLPCFEASLEYSYQEAEIRVFK